MFKEKEMMKDIMVVLEQVVEVVELVGIEKVVLVYMQQLRGHWKEVEEVDLVFARVVKAKQVDMQQL